jgi:hypothetical protein
MLKLQTMHKACAVRKLNSHHRLSSLKVQDLSYLLLVDVRAVPPPTTLMVTQ